MRLPPRCTDRYDVGDPIAAGGCGAVFRATHRALDRTVALKVLHPRSLENQLSVDRFLAEARVTASIAHPHVIIVLDHDVEDGIPWIAYEYIEGPTLRRLIKDGPLAPARALRLAAQIASALDAAHCAGVLHRDVKPENVFESQPGHVKVADFGIARWSENPFKTEAGVLVGTPAYLAPEVCRGGPATPLADLYALGILLFELLTAVRPFTGPNVMAVLRSQIADPAPRVRAVRPEVPEDVDALVDNLLAKDPADRPQTPAAVVARVEEILGPLPDISAGTIAQLELEAAPPPMGRTSKSVGALDGDRPRSRDRAPVVRRLRSKRVRIALAAGVAVSLGIVLAAYSLRPPPAPAPPPSTSSPATDLAAGAAELLARLEAERDTQRPEYESIYEGLMSAERAKQERSGRYARAQAEHTRTHLTELETALAGLGAQEPEEPASRLVVRACYAGWIGYYRIRLDRLQMRAHMAEVALRQHLDSTFALGSLIELDNQVQYSPQVMPTVADGLTALGSAAQRIGAAPAGAPPLAGELPRLAIVIADQFTYYRFRGDTHARFEARVARWLQRLEATDPPAGFRPGHLLADLWRTSIQGDASRRPAELERAQAGFALAHRAMPQATPHLAAAEKMFRVRIGARSTAR